MDAKELFAKMKQSVLDGDTAAAVDLAGKAVAGGADLNAVIDEGFVPGIQEVGRLWEEGEYFLPELMQGADAMKAAMDVIRPELLKKSAAASSGAKVVIGTVQGDIHDIGKTLVATFLEANGFDVIDLGRDVPLEKFVETAESEKAGLVCLSALLTTTMPGHGEVVRQLEDRGIKTMVSVMVGGAPVTRRFAEEIGADGFAPNAVEAVAEARRLMDR
jgi:corrinoid protein of di/trimethylamine methyltransferase